MDSKPQHTVPAIQVRLKAPLHAWVRAEASRQERSANWIINKAIEAVAAGRALEGTTADSNAAHGQ